MAAPDDVLARALAHHLPGALVCATPGDAAFSFSLDRRGQLQNGCFEIAGRHHDMYSMGGIVFRPGPAWVLPRRTRSALEAFAAHEHRAAWCALLSAFPGPVLGRLQPGWFLDRRRHEAALATALAARLGVQFASRTGAAQAACIVVGHHVMAADAGATSRALSAWLGTQDPLLHQWLRDAGLPLARVDGCWRTNNWVLTGVDLVPSAQAAGPRRVAAWAKCIRALLAP